VHAIQQQQQQQPCSAQRLHQQRHDHSLQPHEPNRVLTSWHAAPSHAPPPAPSQRRVHHFPTPPSQHGAATGDPARPAQGDPGPRALVPAAGCYRPDQFLTPSPDSPGQWSSSSPHSGQSDWSEGISSPAAPYPHQPPAGVLPPTGQRRAARTCSKDGVFLVHT